MSTTAASTRLIILLLAVFSAACERSNVGSANTSIVNDQPSPAAININTASAAELQRIPHIGESLASKIIEHREKYGPFRRPEHLMLINGISDKRFRKIQPLVRVE